MGADHTVDRSLQNLDTVVVDFDSGSTPLGSETAALDGQTWSLGACGR